MKKILFAVRGVAILALIGCGGASKEVKKDAAYYKEEFRKVTSIKALNTDERVLFTMKSLRDSFLQSFDVNGTNEGINRDIITIFKSNLENKVDNADNIELGDDTPILLSSRLLKNVSEGKLATQLKAAIKTVCNECKDEEVNTWFIENEASLEKNVEDNNDVDVDDDKQAYYPDVPPPIVLTLCCLPDVPINLSDDHFLDGQALRAEFDKYYDENVR